MATWEDGPEYAPLQRPDRFTLPDVSPLDSAPPPPTQPEAPAERPGFGGPDLSVAPLAALVPASGEEQRDPATPFAVDSDAVTQGGTGGAWGAAHWSPPAGPWPPAGAADVPRGPAALQSFPSQPGPSQPGPSQPGPSQPGPVQPIRSHPAGAFPAPGTPAWFGPGPVDRGNPPPPPSLWRATPPGAIIALAVSVLVWLAPFTFAAGFALSARARYARRKILTAFGVVSGFVLLIPTAGAILNYGDLSTWYASLRGWALVGSLLMIALILVMVNGELKKGPQDPAGGAYSSGGDDRFWAPPR